MNKEKQKKKKLGKCKFPKIQNARNFLKKVQKLLKLQNTKKIQNQKKNNISTKNLTKKNQKQKLFWFTGFVSTKPVKIAPRSRSPIAIDFTPATTLKDHPSSVPLS